MSQAQQDLARAVEQNAVLKFVLDRLPIGLHIPCDVLGDLWGKKTTIRKRLFTDAMDSLLAQFGIGKTKGIVLLGPGNRARRSRSARASSRWGRRATLSAPEAPTVGH